MNAFSVWLKASRLPAQLFIFPSLLFGQAMSFVITGNWNWGLFILIQLYGIFMHFLIVYANDYADYETDLLNESFTPFTGGSRVLVEGLISKKALLKGSLIMMTLVVMSGMLMSVLIGDLIPFVLVVFGLGVFHAYSFNPIRLSYRGFGEILQIIGVGIGLPLIGYSVQGGSLEGIPILLVLALLPAQLAMAISTSLPDEPSDRLSKKNTTVVKLGIKPSRLLLVGLYILALALLITTQVIIPINPVFLGVLIIFIIIQAVLSFQKSVLPGTKPMFYLVALSILTNTVLVTGVAVKLFLYI